LSSPSATAIVSAAVDAAADALLLLLLPGVAQHFI
jgi:hypothetical protein